MARRCQTLVVTELEHRRRAGTGGVGVDSSGSSPPLGYLGFSGLSHTISSTAGGKLVVKRASQPWTRESGIVQARGSDGSDYNTVIVMAGLARLRPHGDVTRDP